MQNIFDKKFIALILISSIFFISCIEKKNRLSKNLESDYDSLSFYTEKIHKESITQRREYINKAFRIAFRLNYNSATRDTLFNLLMLHYGDKNWRDFKHCSSQLLEKAILNKDSSNIGRCYRYIGAYYKNNTEKYDSAFYYYARAEKIYHNYNKIEYANILLNKGIIQSYGEDYLGAELSLLTGYNILKKSENYEKTYETLNQLSIVYVELRDFDKAKEYGLLALDIAKNRFNKDSVLIPMSLNNMGYIYQSLNDFDKAIDNYLKALNNKQLKGIDAELYSNLIDNLAYCKFKINEKKDVLKMFHEALKIRDSLKNYSTVVISKVHLSEYFQKRNNFEEALKFASEAITLARKTKNPSVIVVALKNASQIDTNNVTQYNDEYIKINDSLQIAERNSKDRFARIQLETDELRQEKSVLEERNRNILSYLLGTIVIGGFLFFIRIQRSRQRELALKQSQQQANEEIYRLIISHQNQLEEGRDLEKKRISKELHDGVLGRLFGLRLNLEGLNNFDDTDAKQTRQEYLNELKVIEQDLREISHELNRENLVLINNFEAIINNHLDQQAKNYKPKLTAHLSDNINWEILPNTTKINLYRILQEALQNINKHAEAKHISVQFVKDAKGNLLFTIEDDGKGYNTNSKRSMGIGLSNIVERVHQCEGKIDIRSQLGKGTKIMITFPLENDTINM